MNRDSDRVELVVARHLLGEFPVSCVFVDHEVANQIEASLLIESTLKNHL